MRHERSGSRVNIGCSIPLVISRSVVSRSSLWTIISHSFGNTLFSGLLSRLGSPVSRTHASSFDFLQWPFQTSSFSFFWLLMGYQHSFQASQPRQALSLNLPVPTQASQERPRDLKSTYADGARSVRTNYSLDKRLVIPADISVAMATLHLCAVLAQGVGPGPTLCRPGTSGAAHTLHSQQIPTGQSFSAPSAPTRCNASPPVTGATPTPTRLER